MQLFFGVPGWWPADTRLEVIIGAILTQNTAWANVERAINNLKTARLLDWKGLKEVEEKRLAQLIRSAGYYNQKAKKIKAFLSFVEQDYTDCLDKLAAEPLEVAREKLLEVYGIGPETADSILLYAFQKPSMVVDAYPQRNFSRHGVFPADYNYHQVQEFLMSHLPRDVQLFNQYHALLVYTGKTFCKTKPSCPGCPLEGLNSLPVGHTS